MPPRARQALLLASVSGTCAILSACGSASSPHKPTPSTKAKTSSTAQIIPNSIAPREGEGPKAGNVSLPRGPAAKHLIVATVAGKPVNAAEVEDWFRVQRAGSALADVPDYKKCIAKLKGEAEKRSAKPAPSEGKLRGMCTEHFAEEHAASALGAAIHTQWLLGEAAEEGIKVSDREVEQELTQGVKEYGGRGKFEAYLKGVKQTLPELKAELKVNKMADAIFKRIEAKNHAAATAEVSSYYTEHPQQFTTPAGRAVRIIRTATAASAATAKRELLAGKSFAQLAKELSAIGQPITAKHGEVANMKPHLFLEQALNDAIFSARLGRIYGPIKVTAHHKTIAPETNSGYFIFEVRALAPAHKTPLSEVKAAIAKQLTQQQKSQNLAAFVKAFRSKWKARTDCRPGYVLTWLCRQYKPKVGEAQDPYTL